MKCTYNIKKINNDLEISGIFEEEIDNNTLYYVAASPPDYRASFSGSALPYKSKTQAYENTPNHGSVILKNNTFTFNIMNPNTYYDDFSNTLNPSYVLLNYQFNGQDKILKIILNNTLNNKSLTHADSLSPLSFSNDNEEILSQEKKLKSKSINMQ